ncbi:16S rRNA (cytosine(967)-C(5))-methyltransferase RsmB [Bombilactobacillus apium]|uniref:16S rRNA (cytosine(967)-C(5))-methyltransferase RsmB n=1 Tax=Bombilactobacillus apium TaxID=2675299 RepID=UPI002B4B2E22|nr:16S rRNA (cytosine(967)-C(5))-methyltransferase RsmB [Bombilactobacillus apium]
MTKSLTNNPRYWASKILQQVNSQAGYSNLLLNNCLKGQAFSAADGRLLVQLVYGSLQHQLTIDYYLQKYLNPHKKLAPFLRNLLRISVYQMYYLDRIPERAIFYDATQIAKEVENPGAAKLVTAVLRNLQRHGRPQMAADLSTSKQLSLQASVPEWIVVQLEKQVGLEKTKSILASLNQAPRNSLRVNLEQTMVASLQQELTDQGFDVSASSLSPIGLVTTHGGSWSQNELFQAGKFTLQDESSMLVAPALQVEKDQQILDACAAPGGKTTHLASYLSTGKITALDLHRKKLHLIEENAQRLQVTDRIKTQALDARKSQEVFAAASFDRILVDAPCSGFGLMRRKPEIRYEKTLADIEHLAQIQQDILETVAPLLKVNGLLVYSTCTIFDQENQQVVQHFLQQHPNYALVPVQTQFELSKIHRNQFVKIYPDDYQTDGFFIACLKRLR